jgi:hypothetical protein
LVDVHPTTENQDAVNFLKGGKALAEIKVVSGEGMTVAGEPCADLGWPLEGFVLEHRKPHSFGMLLFEGGASKVVASPARFKATSSCPIGQLDVASGGDAEKFGGLSFL